MTETTVDDWETYLIKRDDWDAKMKEIDVQNAWLTEHRKATPEHEHYSNKEGRQWKAYKAEHYPQGFDKNGPIVEV